jgi:hypothetical protein
MIPGHDLRALLRAAIDPTPLPFESCRYRNMKAFVASFFGQARFACLRRSRIIVTSTECADNPPTSAR